MLPIKLRKTRIGKVWKYTYLPFQCNVEDNIEERGVSMEIKMIGVVGAGQMGSGFYPYGEKR